MVRYAENGFAAFARQLVEVLQQGIAFGQRGYVQLGSRAIADRACDRDGKNNKAT